MNASPENSPSRRLSRGHIGLLLGLIIVQTMTAILASRHNSTTCDELMHITGGYTFNHYNDYRMQPENGNLPQRLHALPLILADVPFPELSHPYWKTISASLFGYSFFYEIGNDPDQLLFAARSMNTLFAIGVSLLVAGWAWRLWGTLGMGIAAGFCAFSPTLLAHSAIATSDMAMACFLLASVSAFWWHLHDPRPWVLPVSALVFGLACVAKFTAVLLPPLFLIMLVARLKNPSPICWRHRVCSGPVRRTAALCSTLLIHGATAFLVIWAFFGFRFSPFNPTLPAGEFHPTLDFMISNLGFKGKIIAFCHDWKLFPEAFIYGFSHVVKHAELRGAFLDGDFSDTGWVSFFPKAFLYKTSPAFLLAVLLAGFFVLVAVRNSSRSNLTRGLYLTLPLTTLFVLYWAFSLSTNLNIGHRHILPTYPVLFILVGALGWAIDRTRARLEKTGHILIAGVAILSIGHASAAVGIYPHFLAYFSPLIGGPAHGYRHLADSSLDWGQDLPGLRDWLAENQTPGEPLYLSYFGGGEPAAWGIDANMMPRLDHFQKPRPWFWFKPGIYAVSATMLQQVYLPHRGVWTPEKEASYQLLRRIESQFHLLESDPYGYPDLLEEMSPTEWAKAWSAYEMLRFARLTTYLRAREPDDMVGYSILIYRLSETEIDRAVNQSFSELYRAVDEASAHLSH